MCLPLIPSDSEDDVCRPQQYICNRASPAPERAGRKAKYIRRRSNQLPVMSSKTFASRKAKAGGQGQKRPTHDCSPGDDTPPTTTLSSFFLQVTNFFFQSVWMPPGTNVYTQKEWNIQGQHAHTKQHIQRGRTLRRSCRRPPAASPARSRLMRVARAPAAAARSILRRIAAGP